MAGQKGTWLSGKRTSYASEGRLAYAADPHTRKKKGQRGENLVSGKEGGAVVLLGEERYRDME